MDKNFIKEKLVHISSNVYKIPYIRSNGKKANRYFILTKCGICKNYYYRDRNNSRKGGVPICSIACKAKSMECDDFKEKYKRGGGEGVVLVKLKNHPNSRKGWIAKHRLIMEKKLGRYLKCEEVVHHINMDKQDNSIDNLHVFPDNKSHFLSHGSLNKCVAHLIKIKVIYFNAKTGMYDINGEDNLC